VNRGRPFTEAPYKSSARFCGQLCQTPFTARLRVAPEHAGVIAGISRSVPLATASRRVR
jgi:hypothetical protein